MVVERRAWKRRSSSPAAAAVGGGIRGAEDKLQGRARPAPGQGYFTTGLAVLFLCLTALLVFLPLVLPPLPPPPLQLLLVPVGLVPSDGRSASGTASSCLH